LLVENVIANSGFRIICSICIDNIAAPVAIVEDVETEVNQSFFCAAQ
jgi:hypothetical protein